VALDGDLGQIFVSWTSGVRLFFTGTFCQSTAAGVSSSSLWLVQLPWTGHTGYWDVILFRFHFPGKGLRH